MKEFQDRSPNRKTYIPVPNPHICKNNENKNNLLKQTIRGLSCNSDNIDSSKKFCRTQDFPMKNSIPLPNNKQNYNLNQYAFNQAPKLHSKRTETPKKDDKDDKQDASKPAFWRTHLIRLLGLFVVVPIFLGGMHNSLKEEKNTANIDFDFYRNLLNVTIHKFASFSFIFLLICVPIITCCTMICKGLLLFKLR
jgi:hypothetical protein